MPSFATLADNFDDGTLDPVLWPLSSGGGLTRETGGRGGVLCTTGFNSIMTAFDWSMPAGAGVFARVWPDTLSGATECFTALRFESDAQPGGTDISIRADLFNNLLFFETRVGHFDGTAVSIPYSATDHAWWRVRRTDATTMLMETAPDAGGAPGTWTTRRTLTVHTWMSSATDLSMFLQVHRNSGTAGWSEIDSVNSSSAAAGTANVPLTLTVAAAGSSAPEGNAQATLTLTVAATGAVPGAAQGAATAPVVLAVTATGAGSSSHRGVILPGGLIPVRSLTTDQILTGSRETRFRVELLDQADTLLGTLDGVTGGVLDWVANAAVKGGGRLDVVDVGQVVNWLTARLRPWLLIEGLPPQPLGVYVVSEAPEAWSDTGRSRTVGLLDKCSILDQDKVPEAYALAAGTVVTTAVVDLIESTGESNIATTASPATLAGPLVWEAGTSKLAIVNDLLQSINYFSLFANFEGQLVAQPYLRPAQRPITWEFLDGATAIYSPDFTRDVDLFAIPNRVIAIGRGDADTAALTSTVDNTDPFSPYSIPSRGRVVAHVEDGVEAADQATLDAYARRRLVELTSPTASVEVVHAPVPGLAVNDAVRLRRVPAGIDHRHVVSKTAIMLDGTVLATSTLREVVDL